MAIRQPARSLRGRGGLAALDASYRGFWTLVVGSFKRNTRHALKLLFWLQLFLRGRIGLLLRYYGLVWLVAGSLTGLSLWMLLRPNGVMPSIALPSFIVVFVCLAMIVLAYGLTRWVGSLSVILLALVLPGTIVVTPSVQSGQIVQLDEDPNDSGLVTGDFSLIFKGAMVCGVLTALSAGTWWGIVQAKRLHMLPRRMVAFSMITGGVLALELLRIVTRPVPDLNLPWEPAFAGTLAEPGWPYAVGTWLWLAVGHFLAVYDIMIVPHLLRRHGQTWVKHDLRLDDAYLVDELMDLLTADEKLGAGSSRSRGRSRSG